MIRNTTLSIFTLALAACTNPSHTANRGVDTIKAPVVHTSTAVYDVRFGGNQLPAAQAQALDEYLSAAGVAYGDRIGVDDRLGAGAAQRREAIADVVARYGLLLDPTVPVTTGAPPPGAVRVVISRSRASVAGCPDWSRAAEYEPEGAVMSNYGCAVRSNLAEMIADPNDLVAGKAYEGADGFAVTKATEMYRRRQPSGFKEGDGSVSPGSGAGSSK